MGRTNGRSRLRPHGRRHYSEQCRAEEGQLRTSFGDRFAGNKSGWKGKGRAPPPRRGTRTPGQSHRAAAATRPRTKKPIPMPVGPPLDRMADSHACLRPRQARPAEKHLAGGPAPDGVPENWHGNRRSRPRPPEFGMGIGHLVRTPAAAAGQQLQHVSLARGEAVVSDCGGAELLDARPNGLVGRRRQRPTTHLLGKHPGHGRKTCRCPLNPLPAASPLHPGYEFLQAWSPMPGRRG